MPRPTRWNALAGGIIIMSLVAVTGYAPGRMSTPAGSDDFTAEDYELELSIDREHKRVAGRETIRLRSTADGLAAIAFPRNGIHVTSLTSTNGTPVAYVTTDDRIEVTFPAPLARGQASSIVVVYSATEPKGVVFQSDAVYSSFHTCHWMVCRDRPDNKATFGLSMVVPDGLALVASGAPRVPPSTADSPGRRAWREPVPCSPYLFGFALGRFSATKRNHGGTTLEYWAAGVDDAWLRRVFADDDRMLDFFVERAGRPLPRSFYRQVVVDGDAAQEMSSFSLLGRQVLEARLTEPTEDWLVAHEMAHQFWGNLVTCADWSQFWLNEGLTVYMVAAYKEARWGRKAYERELELFRRRHQAAIDAHFDVALTFRGSYPSLGLKRAIVYSKGALFIARLRAIMGDRPFWAALRSYTRRYAGRTVTTPDLERAFAAETRQNLAPFFNEWAY